MSVLNDRVSGNYQEGQYADPESAPPTYTLSPPVQSLAQTSGSFCVNLQQKSSYILVRMLKRPNPPREFNRELRKILE